MQDIVLEGHDTPPAHQIRSGEDRLRASFDCLESPTGVVAGLVPATSNGKARSDNNRSGRDKPGHDLRERSATLGRPESALVGRFCGQPDLSANVKQEATPEY